MEIIYKTDFIKISKEENNVKKKYFFRSEFIESLDIIKKVKNHPHPNVIKILEINEKDCSVKFPYFKNGDLFDEIEKNETHKNEKICYQLSLAIQHLHSIDVYHSDIKIDNIFINDSKDYILGDIEKSVGTDVYKSHERIKSHSSTGSKEDDLWALGITIYSLYFEIFPFKKASNKCKIYRKHKKDPNYIFFNDKQCPKSIKDIIIGLLKKNQHERMSIDEVVKCFESILVK